VAAHLAALRRLIEPLASRSGQMSEVRADAGILGERLRSQLSPVYLTLLSIIQGVAMSYLVA
jgi:hypothetical protein